MEEVLEGVFHWRARHPKIGFLVDSYWLERGGVLIDPLVPEDVGLEWFSDRALPPQAVLLSNRHHYRDSAKFVERFGCSVHCSSKGLGEFGPDEPVTGFEFGEDLPGEVLACEVDAICPDESALLIVASRALALADGAVLSPEPAFEPQLGFVPDALMDDPEGTKQGLLSAYRRLLEELDFEHLLLAHGGPLVGNGRAKLEELVSSGGRTAFEL